MLPSKIEYMLNPRRNLFSLFPPLALIIMVGLMALQRNTSLTFSNTSVFISFFVNAGVSLYGLLALETFPYSLNQVYWLFNIAFLFAAPLFQYHSGIQPWGGTPFLNEEFLRANLYILFANLIYLSAYQSSGPHKHRRSKRPEETLNYHRGIILSIFSLCMLGILYKMMGQALFNRKYFDLTLNFGNTVSGHLLNDCIRFFAAAALIMLNFFIREHDHNKKISRLRLFFAVLTVLTIFPLSLPRFYIAAVYLGAILSFFNLQKRYIFPIFFLLAIFIIFPFLSYLRDFTIYQWITAPTPFSYSYFFLGGDFDSYSMLVRTLRYVDQHGIVYLHQLMGVFFFFIPRHLWLMKPIGTGAMLSEHLKMTYKNVSCPFIGEAYINLGFIGIVLFYYALAKMYFFLDREYWKSSLNTFMKTFYICFLSMTFFMLRGDLLSSFSYTIGFLIAIAIVYKVLIVRKA